MLTHLIYLRKTIEFSTASRQTDYICTLIAESLRMKQNTEYLMGESFDNNKILSGVCKFVSFILHPLLVPLYLSLAVMSADAMTILLPTELQRYILNMICGYTLFIPLIAIVALRMLRVIDSYSLASRRERIAPLIVIIVCYSICAVILARVVPYLIWYKIMAAAVACVLAVFVINFFWKISLHMATMGGAIGIMLIMMFGGNTGMFIPLCAGIVLAGMLGSARLYLGKHTPLQVAAGFFLSLLISTVVTAALLA